MSASSSHQTTSQDNNISEPSFQGEHLSDISSAPSSSNDLAQSIEWGFEEDEKTKIELISQLQESNASMKQELDKLTTIAATSQSQYITLKSEFDSYIRRIDTEKREIKIGELKKIVGKFSKLLEQIRLLLLHISSHWSNNENLAWLQLIYDSFIGQELAQLGVFQIQSLWLLPDSDLHEVLMIQQATVEDLTRLQEHNIKLNWDQEQYTLDELTGHCIQELEVWYYYLEWEKRIVIKPSKVVVAQ